MNTSIQDSIVGDFETQFSLHGLRAESRCLLPGEIWVRLQVPGQPTAAMLELAQALEQDFDAQGLTVRISL